MNDSTDPELERLLDAVIDGAMHTMAIAMHYGPTASPGIADVSEAASAQPRAALLGYIAAQYVRRELFPPNELHWREWSAAHPARGAPPGSYKAARGILPWTPGDELPEERIRRLRDGD